ncbi:MAG: hypothetical protein J1F33_07245 [Clostridiales bacterium]|nr:hypothetical protein [Clostridiales bacterium]
MSSYEEKELKGAMEYLKNFSNEILKLKKACKAHDKEVFLQVAELARELESDWHGWDRYIYSIAEELETMAVNLHWDYVNHKIMSAFDEMETHIDVKCGKICELILEAAQPDATDKNRVAAANAIHCAPLSRW